jgi:chromosomal replication initiation ATPase DnaA
MDQLVLDLSRREAFGRAEFFVSDSNAAALDWIDRWPDWPAPVVVLHGPPGAGKTHLVHLWSGRAAAALIAGPALDDRRPAEFFSGDQQRIAVDDADRAPEIALLHLFNACVEARGSLLLTARQAPGPWRPALADLGSRLRAAPAVGIGTPDDTLLGMVLAKHFADRQVRVAAEIIAYLVSKIERSLAAAADIAGALDHAALSRGGAITIPLAHRMLAARAGRPWPPDL